MKQLYSKKDSGHARPTRRRRIRLYKQNRRRFRLAMKRYQGGSWYKFKSYKNGYRAYCLMWHLKTRIY